MNREDCYLVLFRSSLLSNFEYHRVYATKLYILDPLPIMKEDVTVPATVRPSKSHSKTLKKLLESFTVLCGILGYIISEKAEDYGNF